MKKEAKIAIGAGVLLLGVVTLSGCTRSFCSDLDRANILSLYDFGVTEYIDNSTYQSLQSSKQEEYKLLTIDGYPNLNSSNIYYKIRIDVDFNKTLASILATSLTSYVSTPSLKYWEEFDKEVLLRGLNKDASYKTKQSWNVDDIRLPFENEKRYNSDKTPKPKGVLDKYGYLRYFDETKEGAVLWDSWEDIDYTIRKKAYENKIAGLTIDDCPSSDFITLYELNMDKNIAAARSCLAINTGDYGTYGQYGLPAQIESKSWGSAFSSTSFLWIEGLLVWPIGAFIDVTTQGMLNAGVANGATQLLAILIVTVVIRGLMLLLTFKQTQSNTKMQEVQPEIQKIQAKYPNSNSNKYEQQQMAAEMQKLYKKNKINPFMTIIVLIVQFPIFIAVWGAMQGSAFLSTGSFLGLNLSDSISSVLFVADNWNVAAGNWSAITALVLFLLMSGAQAVSMLLPQWLQKAAAKKATKLGRNPSAQSQNNKMKWFTYIMLAMIIFMGFSLVSALGVYWLVGALFSIAQTLIMQAIAEHKKKKQRK